MFRSSFQKGFLTILYAGGSAPLRIWDRMIVNGHVKRVTDEDVRTLALEMRGTNVATCFIYTPINPKEVLGITLPFLVMVVKNLKKYFSFEIQILDDRNMRRRFRVSNYQTSTKVRPFGTTMPIGLNPGWNQIQFNLADFTKRAYGSTYMETQRVQIHANCRIRRIYFCDKLYSDEDLPYEYKLFYPYAEERKTKKQKEMEVVADVPPPSEAGEEAEHEEMLEQAEEEYLEMEASQLDMGGPMINAEEEAAEEPLQIGLVAEEGAEDSPHVEDSELREMEGPEDVGDAEASEPEPTNMEEPALEEAEAEAEAPPPVAVSAD